MVRRGKARRGEACRKEREECREAFRDLGAAAQKAERLAMRFEEERRREMQG